MQDNQNNLIEQIRQTPELTFKQTRNQAIKLDYWQAIEDGMGYCQAANYVASKYQVGVVTVYKLRNLPTKKVYLR